MKITMVKVGQVNCLILICIIAVHSIYGCSDNTHSNKVAELVKFSTIDNIDNINFARRESIVSLTKGAIDFPEDDKPRLLFINKGDCSVCISESVDYLLTYLSAQGLPHTYIGLEGDRELYDYFISQSFPEESSDVNKRLKQIPIIPIYSSADIRTGLYLIVNNRVVDYVQWRVK